MTYVRFQADYIGRTGQPVGIFTACHHLQQAGRLTDEDARDFASIDAWFRERLPVPPFYLDGNSIGAVTWFKETAGELIGALVPLQSLLDRYEVAWVEVRSSDPGSIVYEDEFQIGAIALFRPPPLHPTNPTSAHISE